MTMTISVVIPAYNASSYLPRAIDSVLAQVRPADEILVVDDGSTDDTQKAIAPYLDHVRYIRQDNAGASVARNTGITAATGDWIAFLDADDELLPKHLQLLSDLVARHPDLVWCTGNFIRCHCDRGHEQHEDLTPPRLAEITNFLQGREVFESYFSAHVRYAAGCTDTMLIRRDVLLEAGLFEPGRKRINDMDLWFRIAYRHGPIGFVPEPIAIYHVDVPESTIKLHRDPEGLCDFIDRHLDLAAKYNKLDDFKPCAKKMIGWWIKEFLEAKQSRNAKELLCKYRSLFTKYNFVTTYIHSLCPAVGNAYERMKRRF
ncbi:MAG: glycosyltransferase family 2 protein [Sedimentisphaerales bacterium]|nr:glycosyltransferase family 2 protein [Sedimentisphaerales bacterium]